MKKSLLIAAAVIAVAAIALIYTRQPTTDLNTLQDSNRGYNAEILRDKWGVPHIIGETDADAAFGLAYAHAEDDFVTIQGALLAARGRLAEVYGQDGAPNDYLVRLLRLRETVAAGYAALDSATRALCEGYAAGLNYYAALHPEAALAQLYPARGQDLVSGFLHKTPLFFGMDKVLKQVIDRVGEPTEAVQPAGSNAIAVAPSRSADGHTRLLINSHQPWLGPVAWYEAHLISRQGMNVTGGLFPGSPVILHGHNADLGWAHTVNKPDLVDVYRLKLNPENPNQYWFDDEWLELEKADAAIRVKLLGPISWTFERELLWSVHGPVIRQENKAFAIRYADAGAMQVISQWYGMNRAQDLASWLEAFRLQGVPMFNTVYADKAGNIGYIYNARMPQRPSGYDWQAEVRGDTSSTLWHEYVSFDSLPMVFNPASGFVQNCNNLPFTTTTGDDNPVLAYGGYSGILDRDTNRGRRALELFGEDQLITAQEFERYKYDTTYGPESKMAAWVRWCAARRGQDNQQLAEALDRIAKWSMRAEPDDTTAGLALLALNHYVKRDTGSAVEQEVLGSVLQAAIDLEMKHGTLAVQLKKIQFLVRGEEVLGIGGGPDVLRAVYSRQTKDTRLIGNAGDSFFIFAEWGKDGEVASRSIHQFGSATSHPDSPHYSDQAELFVSRQVKTAPFTISEVEEAAVRRYKPGEELN